MQISVIAYTNTEENKKQLILQGAGDEKKTLKNLFLAILAFDTLLAVTKSEKKNQKQKKS